MKKTCMKPLSNKTLSVILLSSLLLVLLFSGLNLPNLSAQAQAEVSPTPTANPEQVVRSGDTEGLILGAGIILFIILGGVIIQRMILKEDIESPKE